MQTKKESILLKPLKGLFATMQFVMIIVGLNYFASKSQSATDYILGQDFINQNTHKSQVFHSTNGLLFLEKQFVFLASWLVVGFLDRRNKKKQQPQQNVILQRQGQQFQYIGTKQQIILGLLTFVAIKSFLCFQSLASYELIIWSKYLNFLFIIVLINYITHKEQSKNTKSIFNKYNLIALFIKLLLTLSVLISTIVIKHTVLQLSSFYQIYVAKWQGQLYIWTGYLVCAIVLGFDCLLYVWVYRVKQNKFLGKKQKTPTKLTTVNLLKMWSKYTALCFLLNIALTGQLFYMINFIWRHPSILSDLLELSICHLCSQYITCYSILAYKPHVFFSIMASNGILIKRIFIITKSFTNRSLLFYVVFIELGLLLIQIVWDRMRQANELKNIKKQDKDSDNHEFMKNDGIQDLNDNQVTDRQMASTIEMVSSQY